MARITDLRPCPKCGAQVAPVSICSTCGSVAVRTDVRDIGRELSCQECGASNPTLFVCQGCNTRFLFEDMATPAAERFACVLCGTFVEASAKSCPACGAVFEEEVPPLAAAKVRLKRRVRGEYADTDLEEIARIPGVGRAKAEALCRAGFNALWKIKRASDEELGRVPAIGPRGAKTVKDSLRFILLLPRRKTKEEVLEEEYECPLCSCPTALFANACRDCGAAFDEVELDDELRAEVEREHDKGLLAYYDVHLDEEPNDGSLWYARALLLLEMGQPQEAVRSIDSALRLDPSSRRAILARSRILGAAGEGGQAAVSLRAATEGLVPAARPPAPPPEPKVEETPEDISEALEALEALAERECPLCGEHVLPDAKVCPACGSPLGEEPVPASAGPAEGGEPAADLAALDELQRLFEAGPVPEPAHPAAKPKVQVEEPVAEEPEEAPPPVPRAAVAPPPRVGFRSPEIRPRRGLINGHGLINGSGRVNGLINGTGFMDSSIVTELRVPRRSILIRYLVVAGSMLMAFAVAASILPPSPAPMGAIAIDGDPADWAGVPAYTDPSPAADPNVAIQRYAAHLEAGQLSVLVQVAGQALGDPSGYDAFYAFFDVDASPATGYRAGALGADYVAEVVGGSGAVATARLYEFPSDAEVNWSRRAGVPGVVAAARGSSLEFRVDTDEFATFSPTASTFLIAADNFEGASSRAGVVITGTHGAIRVRQVPLGSVLPAGSTDVLRLEISAVGVMDTSDAWVVGGFGFAATSGVAASATPTQVTLTSSSPTASVVVAASATGLTVGSRVEVSLSSLTAPRPVTVVGDGVAAYFSSVPPGIRVDGLFLDWAALRAPDTDPSPVPRPSLDLAAYGGSANASGTFFHLEVAGALYEGSPAPQRLHPAPPGGGGGGGPPAAPPPRVTGEDIARVYIDANSTDSAGTPVGGVLADVLVEVRGTNGRITSQDAYRWSPGWVLDPALGPDVAKNATALEGSVLLGGAELNATEMVFETSDWSESADVSAVYTTRGTAGRTRSAPGAGVLSDPPGVQLLVTQPLGTPPTIDGTCGASEYAGAGTAEQNNMSIKAGTNGLYLFLCIQAKWDTTNGSAADYAWIHFDRDHTGEPGPLGGHRRFEVTGADVLSPYRGNAPGTAWEACPTSGAPDAVQCHSGNAAAANFSTTWFYEFGIHFLDVWNTTTPGATERVGFAILLFDSNNATYYRWGSTQAAVDTMNLDTWGHLEIPEVPDMVAVSVASLVILVVLRRRRQVT